MVDRASISKEGSNSIGAYNLLIIFCRNPLGLHNSRLDFIVIIICRTLFFDNICLKNRQGFP
ncbi:MAG: hypothetical protein CVU97_06420 [Firmicutes bacterium HGW-Firmicutes-21]|nr:MAG: hypothetical protein CVU97_06420 [Firmicutes bacterium HGW-Firmicutes-21]